MLIKLIVSLKQINFPPKILVPAAVLFTLFLSACVGNTLMLGRAPINSAVSVAFTDMDSEPGQIAGNIVITKAYNEIDIVAYEIYWSTNGIDKAAKIVEINKIQRKLTYRVVKGTRKAAEYTHFLVITKNAAGEMTAGVNVEILDSGAPPIHKADAVAFRDDDDTAGELSGNIIIAKATNEMDITHYNIYWGKSALEKIDGSNALIVSLAKTGSNLIYALPNNTPKPEAATHILVFTKNGDGEMNSGMIIRISDDGLPIYQARGISFVDRDRGIGTIGGDIVVVNAVDEKYIESYVIYWSTDGIDRTIKLAETYAVGSERTVALPNGTAVRAGYFLAATKNKSGEMASSVSVQINDRTLPINQVLEVGFRDDDNTVNGLIEGTIYFTQAEAQDSWDIDSYVVYWSTDGTDKTIKIAETNKYSSSPRIQVTLDSIQIKESYFLVVAKNSTGEAASGLNVQIRDGEYNLGRDPNQAAGGISFTDTDTRTGRIGGTIDITKAVFEQYIDSYVIYWSENGTAKSIKLIEIAKTGSDLQVQVPNGTEIKEDYFLVFSRNSSGESRTGVKVRIVDRF